MQIKPVTDKSFLPYGKILTGYNLSCIWPELRKTNVPQSGIEYVASHSPMEKLEVFNHLQNSVYGGMQMQLGYCNGNNKSLNGLEYHRGSELCIADDSVVLWVAPLHKMSGMQISSGEVEAFEVPANTAVLLYETTMHFAPCSTSEKGFRVAIGLLRGTNAPIENLPCIGDESALLWGCNKWLIVHKDSCEAAQGAHVGIIGENISI